MNFKILDVFDNYIDASLSLGRMEEAGIKCWLKDENTATISPIFTNAIGGIKLMVAEDDMAAAKEILQALKDIKRKSFACPYCGSNNIEYITTNRNTANVISSILTWLFGNYAIGIHKIWHCFTCNKEFEEPVDMNNSSTLNEEG